MDDAYIFEQHNEHFGQFIIFFLLEKYPFLVKELKAL
jgi:hypothetical protein